MVSDQNKVRALGLCSGGLDSRLSAMILRRQGIDVEWVNFETPFFSSAKAREAARLLKVPLTVKKITRVYLEMLTNPPCGYGQHMNPCLDCHALMFRLAGKILRKKAFDFLFSGEVLEQRPMSQTKPSLRYVEKNSGFEGYILRPLSAKKLPITIPEKEGKVNRELLLDITGRSRKKQIAFAKAYGITEYPAPAGGCLLTDKGYSNRLRDLLKYYEALTDEALSLLKYGRHFRINPTTKIIVGRTQKDNEHIEKLFSADKDTIITIKEYPGPTTLLPHEYRQDAVFLAAAICVGYSKAPKTSPVEVSVLAPHKNETIQVIAVSPNEIQHLLI
jgi:tRNA U34 2-thiouridine synthase MnmA/TrmU